MYGIFTYIGVGFGVKVYTQTLHVCLRTIALPGKRDIKLWPAWPCLGSEDPETKDQCGPRSIPGENPKGGLRPDVWVSERIGKGVIPWANPPGHCVLAHAKPHLSQV